MRTATNARRAPARSSGALLMIVLLTAGISACGGGGRSAGAPPAGPPTPPPPPPTGAFRWDVSLAAAGTVACFRPDSVLPLNVTAFTEGGAQIANPHYEVSGNVSGAVESDGAGGWTLRGEGATRITVTYLGEIHPNGTVAPVSLDLFRDGTAPQISIDTPTRGAMVTATSDVRVQGQATDAISPIQSVTLNGVEQVTATPALSEVINAAPAGRWGLNIIEVAATDSCGNRATLSQSYLRSPDYRPAATAANATARVPHGQSLKLTQAAVDDGNRSDVDDIATLTERYLERNFSTVLSQATAGETVVHVAAPCPGVGYTLSIAAAGARVTGPRVEALTLQTAALQERLSFERLTVPLHLVQVTRIGLPAIGCAEAELEFSPVYSAHVTSNSTTSAAAVATGRIDVNMPSIAVALDDVQLSVTGIGAVDNFLSSIVAALNDTVESAVESQIQSQVPPLVEQLLNVPLTASATLAAGPFDLTLSAVAGVDGIAIVPAATTETAYTQIHPGSTGTPHPALGAIARPTAAANLASNPGPVTFAVDDNVVNQGLWALWHGGALEVPDVIGMPGASLGLSALLPPVLMPGEQPGEAAFGIGDLAVTLRLDLAAGDLAPVEGHVEVEGYVSYVGAGSIAYDGVTKKLRLRTTAGASEAHVHVTRISDGTEDIVDPALRAPIEDYARTLLSRSVEQFADETLIAALLPPLRFQFTAPAGGGTVGALTLDVVALARTADHVVIDMALVAEEPPDAGLDGQLTLNNPWTPQDLEDLNIPQAFHDDTPTIDDSDPLAAAARSIAVRDYRRTTRPNCENDVTGAGVHKCLPQWKFPLNYGWYCGAGRPIVDFKSNPMLDPVDYCCRLHDQNLFGGETALRHNACGFIMCLSKATGSPADITERLPDVENARRQMYNKAALLCGPAVQPELPEPAIVP